MNYIYYNIYIKINLYKIKTFKKADKMNIKIKIKNMEKELKQKEKDLIKFSKFTTFR